MNLLAFILISNAVQGMVQGGISQYGVLIEMNLLRVHSDLKCSSRSDPGKN
jgi:hypothetical protein